MPRKKTTKKETKKKDPIDEYEDEEEEDEEEEDELPLPIQTKKKTIEEPKKYIEEVVVDLNLINRKLNYLISILEK